MNAVISMPSMGSASSSRPPVLLVEDNDGDADLITELLSEAPPDSQRRVIRAVRLSDAVAMLRDLHVEVVLLDLRLPDGSGVECIEALRCKAQDVPIVVLTGLDDDHIAISCVAAGAQDYLSKQDVQARSLTRAIDYAVVRAHEAEERLRAQHLQARSAELELENQRILEANRLKSQFLANMSHELRTPLNAIIGFAELMHGRHVQPDSPNFYVYIGHILAGAKHLLQLISDILDLASIEAGRMDLHPESVDPHVLAREVVDVIAGSFHDKKIDVDVQLDEGLREVWTDPRRFRQLLYNYLSNAWKFTPDGGRVALRMQAIDNERFVVEVEDSGVGIGSSDLSRLFTDFTQLQSHAGKRYAGTGLGLSLTKRIVEAQHGTVGVRSIVGKGSVFYAELPIHAPAGTE